MKNTIFENKRLLLQNLISEEENKIRLAKNEIYQLNNELCNHIRSCEHVDDDGKCTFKDTSYWEPDISTYIDDWTGDEMEQDNGYTVYEKTCIICDLELNGR